MGMVKPVEPYTTIRLDTTVGLVECKVRVAGGRPKSVTITNVPSFLYRQRVVVPVCGFGPSRTATASEPRPPICVAPSGVAS